MILKVCTTLVMIVCVCANVTERQLEAVIRDGATTMKEVARRCGAGAGCGTCRAHVRECLRQARDTSVEQSADVTMAATALPATA